MKKNYGHWGETQLLSLAEGWRKAKQKWQVRYEKATSNNERQIAQFNINLCSENIAFFVKAARKEGVRV